MNKIDDIISDAKAPYQLSLYLNGVAMELRSDDAMVLQAMRGFYHHFIAEVPTTPLYQIWVLDLDPAQYMPNDRSAFQRYVVSDGRSKDPFLDHGEIRYVVKRSTGQCVVFDDHRYVVFWKADTEPGELRGIINEIHMREMVERGYTIVHGAAMELGGVGITIVGQAGAGKTTSLLKIMAAGGTYISGDKTFIRSQPASDWFEMIGVVKWPRVLGGTMYGDSRLRALLPTEARERYARMSFSELFAVKDKYDVNIDSTYGAGRTKYTSRSRRMYLLAWNRQHEGFAIERVDTKSNAFWETFGPSVARDAAVLDRNQRSSLWTAERQDYYRRSLNGLELFTIKGKLDFERIAPALTDHLEQTS